MYIHQLKLWNFRKFGNGEPIFDNIGKLRKPDLLVNFNRDLNLIVGENDSGKSGIIDAIKLICKTHSTEWIKIEQEDFHNNCERLRIECIFKFDSISKDIEENKSNELTEISIDEAKNFTEWLGLEKISEKTNVSFRINLDVQKTNEKILPYDVKAGPDDIGTYLDATAKEYLKCIYLKPLRDAKNELIPKRNSRLSQILGGHKAFKDKAKDHHLIGLLNDLNKNVKKYFEGKLIEKDNLGNDIDIVIKDQDGKELNDQLNLIVKELFPFNSSLYSLFNVTGKDLKNILESLRLNLEDENAGLGSQNLLFIAIELLLLQKEPWTGIRLGLIEELEAHIHPQAQMRNIEYLQKESSNKGIQLILTSHSPNLASKVNLKNLILCSDSNVFPMGPGYSELDETNNDYNFLKRFLDVTKSNLFFAKGIIFVEGNSENILLPILADKIGKNLTSRSVSVINVGNASFLRFAKIFIRKDMPYFKNKVAVITDYDFRPDEFDVTVRNAYKKKKKRIKSGFTPEEIIEILKSRRIKNQCVKTFFSPFWTFEYCLAKSKLRKEFYSAVLLAWKEKKRSQGIKSYKSIEVKLNDIENQFNKWTLQDEKIAFEIYNNIILKMNLSKVAIAQYFAEIISADTISIDITDKSLKYLFNAINYVTEE